MKIAKEQGTSYADIRYGKNVIKNIIAEDGIVVNETNCVNSGYGIRMLSEGIETFSSVPNPEFAEKEIKKAIRVSKLLTNWKKGISNLAEAPVSAAGCLLPHSWSLCRGGCFRYCSLYPLT